MIPTSASHAILDGFSCEAVHSGIGISKDI